ncbi:MAG: oligosaccharide flippase family protein [Clostridiaceae bacterium]
MKEQSTSKGFAILSAGTVLVKIISLLYIPFLRAIIGDEGYGIFGAAYQVYVFMFVVTNSGIPVAISKLVSELNAKGNYRDAVKSFKLSRFILLLLGILMSLILVAMAAPLSKAVHFEKAYLSIIALAPAILFTSVASAYRGYFQGNKNMIPTAFSQVFEQVTNTIFALIFSAYLMRYGLEVGCAGAPIGTSVGALISAAFLIYYYEKIKKSDRTNEIQNAEGVKRLRTRHLLLKIIYYSLPITICVSMTYAGNLVDLYNTKVRLMAGGFNETQATILYGYLVKYQQLLNVPIAIISALAAAILPALSSAAAVRNKELLTEKINYSLRICFLVALPSAAGLGILSGPIYNMLVFGNGSYIMAWGSIVLILLAVMQIQSTILQGIGKLYIATLFSIIGIAVKITANYFVIAIPEINILGAVIGSILGFSIPIILNQIVINRSLRGSIRLLDHAFKPIIASIFMTVLVFVAYSLLKATFSVLAWNYFTSTISVIMSVIIGAYSYLYGLVLTGGVSKKDMEIVPARLRQFIPESFMNKMA